MSRPLRWGIFGTGTIAAAFARELRECRRGELAAVGSRDRQRAEQFTESHGGTACGGYDDLLADETVDAIYNATPNGVHEETTIRALEAGKHVLCEKPMGAGADEAERMFDAADRAGRVLIEGFMYRAHPGIDKLIETVRGGAIGKLKLIRTAFTFNRDASADDARYQPRMGGGSLMDVGCYCVNLARAVTGNEPTDVNAMIHLHPHGVDDYAAGTLRFPDDVLCAFVCGMTVNGDRTTYLLGDGGWIEIDTPWFCDGTFTVVTGQNERRETVRVDGGSHFYAMEAEAFAAAVQDGAEPWITREDTLGNMRALDRLGQSAGLPF